jgi:hypothetical protein
VGTLKVLNISLFSVLATLGWSIFKDVLEWNSAPTNLNELHIKLIEGSARTNSLFVFIFGCFAWSLWLIRNDLVFNDAILTHPDVSVFCTISLMQKWKVLLKEQERRWMNSVIYKRQLQLSLLRSDG